MKYKSSEISISKEAALKKIKLLLEAEDVDSQFDLLSGDYHSKDKFIVSWIDNWKGIPSEYSIDKCDAFYAKLSGQKAILATRSLFHEKQLAGYNSIERALIEVGIKLSNKNEKQDFYNTYATKYNTRLREAKLSKNS